MKIDINTLKNLIKEELRKVLKEEFHTDPVEREKAIEDMMKTFNLSRDEAVEEINKSEEEMMAIKTFRDSMQQDNKALKAFEDFKKLSSKYQYEFDDDHPAKEFLMKDFKNSKLDFEEDFLIQKANEIITQNNSDDADLILGYNACMNDVDEELAKLLDIEGKIGRAHV